jgi:hypothetical protein
MRGDSDFTITLPSDDEEVKINFDDITMNISDYGAAQSTYAVSGSSIDTITIDSLGSAFSNTPFTWDSTAKVNIDADGVQVKDGGDIKIGNQSLKEFMDKVEERLAILRINPELEEKWGELKSLGEKYRELEKEILEKEKLMEMLKTDV